MERKWDEISRGLRTPAVKDGLLSAGPWHAMDRLARLTESDDLAEYCLAELHAHLAGTANKQIVDLPDDVPRAGIFVTIRQAESRELRGCIGTVQPVALTAANLGLYARRAAFCDSRFPPVTLRELPALAASVSLLHSLRKIDSTAQICLGRHGVLARMSVGGEWGEATFLPQVAAELGWDVGTTLDGLVKKAGLAGGWADVDAWDVWVYEAAKTGFAGIY